MFCDAPPLILFRFGDLAITTHSIPSVLAVPFYLIVCLVLCIRRGVLRCYDPLLLVGLAAVQIGLMKTGAVGGGAAGLPGYALLAPVMIFLVGYGCWRLAGQRPLVTWPWPRFGLVSTLSLLLADAGVALVTPVAPGRVWQLGGACMKDALLIGPPFLTIIFYGLLDCHSPWVFCSQKCVGVGRCRFGMDGKSGNRPCHCDAGESVP